MHRLRVHREIDAPAEVLWELLTDTEQWPTWGPTVLGATVDGDSIRLGATGTVTTAIGLSLPFEITEYDESRSWAWTVAGVQATSHSVDPLGPARSRVGFGVPWIVAPYLAVCRLALHRLARRADELTGAAP